MTCNQLLYNYMDIFLYYSQTLCRLFLYLLIYNCIYYTWNIQGKWILPVTWCESTCNFGDALMYKYFLLNAVFSKLLQVVQFSYFMHANPFYVYYLNIYALQLFCILFPFTFTCIVSNYILYTSFHFINTYQQSTFSSNRFTVTWKCIMM